MGKPSSASKVSVSGVSVRPIRDGAERAEWNRLMDAHHDLGFRCLFGGGLWHVAETLGGAAGQDAGLRALDGLDEPESWDAGRVGPEPPA